jgi:pantoate--beta-alanine ligase
MKIIETIADLHAALSTARRGAKIAFVPTMGALHEGHLSLVNAARAAADIVVVSIFVNPTQFAPHEDFNAYPRDVTGDVEKILSMTSNAIIFTPAVNEIYPDKITDIYQPGKIAQLWEGEARPTHFAGVAQVVQRLFDIVQPDMAFLGEKDFQQLQVIRHMASDLSLPIEIRGVATMREVSGLAMSSRNQYLSAIERNKIAPQIFLTLQNVATEIRSGKNIPGILESAKKHLTKEGFDKIDYLAYVDSETLLPLAMHTFSARCLFAGWLGKARLIDNIAV